MNINARQIRAKIRASRNQPTEDEKPATKQAPEPQLAFPKPGKKPKSTNKSRKAAKKKQRRARLINYKALKKYARENPYCEWCAYELEKDPNYKVPCKRPTTNPHHCFYKSQGGPDIPENFATLWDYHHDKAHEEGIEAREFIFKYIKKIPSSLIRLWDPERGLNS